MKKYLFIISLVLVSFISISAQNIEGKEIKNRELEWSDFVGKVDETSKWDANTAWVTTYTFPRPSFDGDKAQINLRVRLFLRNSSWVKPNKQTARLLNHERGHFNIGRICAKKIENTVNATAFDRNDYPQQVDAIYRQIIEQCKDLEKQYDNETNHYQNQGQQTLWDKKLKELLKR